MRGDDQNVLPTDSRHIVRILRRWKGVVAVQPKETAIDRPTVGFPRGCKRAYKLNETLWQNPFAVPDAVLQVKIRDACPIASCAEFVTMGQKIPVRVRFDDHVSHTDLVEQCPSGK